MSIPEGNRVRLGTLLEQGSLPRSECGASFLRLLAPLLTAAVVVEDRVGGGRRLVVEDEAALRKFADQHFPNLQLPDATPARVTGVARFRDSKAGAGDTPDILTLRAWSDPVVWRDGTPVPAAQATREHGVFAFRLTPTHPYELRGACALVENPAVLLAFEQLRRPDIAAAIYGGGRLSKRALDWLGSQSSPEFRLVHFPDYDPVGLSEFCRLHSALGPRVTLHLPADLAQTFARFSNRELLRRLASQGLLPKLRKSPLAEVKAVLALLEQYNSGLEQEALLIDRPASS